MSGDIGYRMISTRNRIPGKVVSVTSDRVVSEVIVETAVGKLASIITTFSVQNMQLKEGDDVLVMIKATEAMIEKHGTEAV
jgi:molybdate transport system regulatory protein